MSRVSATITSMGSVRGLIFLLLSCTCLDLGARQIPAAIVADSPPDQRHPAAMEAFLLPSHGSELNALMYIAAGAGPHPVVILLHGFPGNEKNLDLAQAIRRAGWNVLYFDYRGSWGSPGAFSFTHSTEDVASALAYLREPGNALRLRTDSGRIVLLGHSFGGFLAVYGGAHDPGVLALGMISAADLGAWAASVDPAKGESQAVAKLAAGLAEQGMSPLSGCTPEGLANEMLQHEKEWHFSAYGSLMSNRPLLLITSDDGLAGSTKAFAEVLRKRGHKRLTEVHLATDHSYSDKRIALEEAVLDWLGTIR